jgi:uncharacterized protein YndB with AHSA1/START domain
MADIERELDLPAPPDEVWTALTDPEELTRWFGAEVWGDLEPGGTAVFREDDGTVRRAVVEEADAPHRLTFRWWPEGGDDWPSRVEYELMEVPGGTRLRVVERLLAPTGAWSARLGGLRAHLALCRA